MKKDVLRYDKCLFCGEISSYVIRDTTSSRFHYISDDGIRGLIEYHTANPFEFKQCPCCNMHSKQETVAWDIYEQTEE